MAFGLRSFAATAFPSLAQRAGGTSRRPCPRGQDADDMRTPAGPGASFRFRVLDCAESASSLSACAGSGARLETRAGLRRRPPLSAKHHRRPQGEPRQGGAQAGDSQGVRVARHARCSDAPESACGRPKTLQIGHRHSSGTKGWVQPLYANTQIYTGEGASTDVRRRLSLAAIRSTVACKQGKQSGEVSCRSAAGTRGADGLVKPGDLATLRGDSGQSVRLFRNQSVIQVQARAGGHFECPAHTSLSSTRCGRGADAGAREVDFGNKCACAYGTRWSEEASADSQTVASLEPE